MFLLILPLIGLYFYRFSSIAYLLYMIHFTKNIKTIEEYKPDQFNIYLASWITSTLLVDMVFQSYLLRVLYWFVSFNSQYTSDIFLFALKVCLRYNETVKGIVSRVLDDYHQDLERLRNIWDPQIPMNLIEKVNSYYKKFV